MSQPNQYLSVSEVSVLPRWAGQLVKKYYAGEASHFLLYHNVHDLVRARDQYVGLVQFLRRELLGNKNVIMYDRSQGITFGSPEVERKFLAQLRVADPLMTKESLQRLPKDPGRALPLVEHFLFYGDQVAAIIDFLETIIPAGEVSYLGGEDRNNLVALQRWITSSRLLSTDNIVILITESLSDVNPRIRENSRLATIQIPYPDDQERLDFIRYFNAMNPGLKMVMTEEQLAQLTSGLNRVHINSLMRSAQLEESGLTFEAVRLKKKEIIESECFGLIEFVTPKYGLEHVGGMTQAKEFMRSIAETIKQGRTDEAPMGILLSGPVGTGKTFLAECFAKDCGLNVVEFKNFREKWVGSTEANLEKILNLLRTLAPIVVLIDEADAALGNRGTDGDSGVNARVFSKIANAMGDTSNRGRILWVLMTCRPDLLPIDLKRQGRCEEHISLFYPQTEQDRLEITEAMVKKNKIQHTITDWSPITKHPLELSGADIESMLIRVRREARRQQRQVVTQEDLVKLATEFIPARDELELEYQTLVAVLEATSREMIPLKYRTMPPAEISRRVEELKMLV
ncbi:MAG: ATP-binding protein [Acidobacteria bacterium]|nr:ATP-binding protein [Acidobacteriota bacterium]